MQRREFIALLGSVAIAAPRNAVAQTPSKVYRVALVSPAGPLLNPIRT
jgi:putative ABC transport system substrate-binding protein